jgi:NADH-quinone oxidoreductase subunit E
MALQFSPQTESEFQELLTHYPTRHAALLPALFLAQKEFGWISVEVMDYLAARLELSPSKVLTTATFYTMYNKAPVGRCHVQVCTTLSCAFRGGYELLEKLEDRLGIRVGETTPDGHYTLSEVECLASCGSAPMFQITDSRGNIEYFENLDTDQKLDALLAKLNERVKSLPDPRKMH